MTLKSVTFKQHSLFPSLVLFFSLPPALRISVTLSFSLFNFSVTCAIFFFLPSINRAPKLTGTSGHQHRSTGHTKYYTGTTETHPVLRPLIEAENGCKKGSGFFQFSFLLLSTISEVTLCIYYTLFLFLSLSLARVARFVVVSLTSSTIRSRWEEWKAGGWWQCVCPSVCRSARLSVREPKRWQHESHSTIVLMISDFFFLPFFLLFFCFFELASKPLLGVFLGGLACSKISLVFSSPSLFRSSSSSSLSVFNVVPLLSFLPVFFSFCPFLCLFFSFLSFLSFLLTFFLSFFGLSFLLSVLLYRSFCFLSLLRYLSSSFFFFFLLPVFLFYLSICFLSKFIWR